MAEVSSFASQFQCYDEVPYSACDDEIPTVDYSLLFSDNPNQQLDALQRLRHACLEYGFFYVTLFAILFHDIFRMVKFVNSVHLCLA